jgi:hypothetical protein
VDSRLATAAAGLAISLGVSAVLYRQFGVSLLLVVVPFLPFLVLGGDERPPPRQCPDCGFATREDAVRYCPHDGTRLE